MSTRIILIAVRFAKREGGASKPKTLIAEEKKISEEAVPFAVDS